MRKWPWVLLLLLLHRLAWMLQQQFALISLWKNALRTVEEAHKFTDSTFVTCLYVRHYVCSSRNLALKLISKETRCKQILLYTEHKISPRPYTHPARALIHLTKIWIYQTRTRYQPRTDVQRGERSYWPYLNRRRILHTAAIHYYWAAINWRVASRDQSLEEWAPPDVANFSSNLAGTHHLANAYRFPWSCISNKNQPSVGSDAGDKVSLSASKAADRD